MDTSSKKGLTMALAVSLIAVGLVTASSLMHGIIVSTYAKTLFLPAIVHGSTEDQKISCSTAGSKNTHGLYFSAFARDGSLDGYWDIASYQWSPWEPYKGGFISGGKTNGTTYELEAVEQQDGICHAKGDKNVIISGKCGNDVVINFKTINGTSRTFTGNVKCVGHTGFK